MTSELKCPFCNKKLEPIGTSGQFQCGTWGCDASFNFIATRDVWEYIARTRKDLEIARKALEYVSNEEFLIPDGDLLEDYESMQKAIKQALEQIEHIADASKMIEHKETQ